MIAGKDLRRQARERTRLEIQHPLEVWGVSQTMLQRAGGLTQLKLRAHAERRLRTLEGLR